LFFHCVSQLLDLLLLGSHKLFLLIKQVLEGLNSLVCGVGHLSGLLLLLGSDSSLVLVHLIFKDCILAQVFIANTPSVEPVDLLLLLGQHALQVFDLLLHLHEATVVSCNLVPRPVCSEDRLGVHVFAGDFALEHVVADGWQPTSCETLGLFNAGKYMRLCFEAEIVLCRPVNRKNDSFTFKVSFTEVLAFLKHLSLASRSRLFKCVDLIVTLLQQSLAELNYFNKFKF